MRILTTLFLLVMGLTANAQVLLIHMNFGDCDKCSLNLEQLKFSNIPAYIVLDEGLVSDRSDIEERYGFEKMGFKTIFSNELHQKIKSNSSTVYLLGVHGDILFQQSLFNLQQEDIERVKHLQEGQYYFLSQKKYMTNIKEGKIVDYFSALNSYTVTSEKDTIIYKLSDKDISKALELVFKDGKTNQTKYTALYSKKPFLKPNFIAHSAHKGYAYLLAKFHYENIQGRDTMISYKHAMFKYKDKKLENVYQFNLPPLDTTALDDIYFAIKDENSFLFCYYPERQPKPGRYNPFIGEFILKENKISFNRWLNIDLPEVYKSEIGYNYMSFRMVEYPYCIFNLATEVIDLEQEESHKYNLPVALDFSTLKNDGIRQLSNQQLYYHKKNSMIYIMGKVHGKWKLMTVSTQTWKLVDYIDLTNKIPSIGDDTRFLHIDPLKEIFYAPDENGFVKGYPLAIVLSK
jgi:hypothetical protein